MIKLKLKKILILDYYTKKEVDIEMRDGIKLHTTIYSPKDLSQEYPIIMQRTPYSSRPYGEGEFRSKIGPNEFLMKEGNIIVYQDVRGRWMSEGDYDNMRPYIPNKKGKEILVKLIAISIFSESPTKPGAIIETKAGMKISIIIVKNNNTKKRKLKISLAN